MAGNYGGASTPTQAIGGLELFAGKGTTYKNWVCSTIVSSANTATVTIDGNLFTISSGAEGVGTSIQLVVNPTDLTATPAGVYFLCYCDSCKSPFSGGTAPSFNYNNSGGGPNGRMQPVILGGQQGLVN